MQFTFAFSSQLNFRSKREAETEKTFAKHVSSHFGLCDRNTWNLICIRTRTKEMSITELCVGVVAKAFPLHQSASNNRFVVCFSGLSFPLPPLSGFVFVRT